jgi:hypothetical protein
VSDDLRDTFAAAALTGLLAQGDDGSFSEESYARAAYRWADAMLGYRKKNDAGFPTDRERVVRLPRHDIATGPVGIGWNAAMTRVVAELEAAGVRWEYENATSPTSDPR